MTFPEYFAARNNIPTQLELNQFIRLQKYQALNGANIISTNFK